VASNASLTRQLTWRNLKCAMAWEACLNTSAPELSPKGASRGRPVVARAFSAPDHIPSVKEAIHVHRRAGPPTDKSLPDFAGGKSDGECGPPMFLYIEGMNFPVAETGVPRQGSVGRGTGRREVVVEKALILCLVHGQLQEGRCTRGVIWSRPSRPWSGLEPGSRCLPYVNRNVVCYRSDSRPRSCHRRRMAKRVAVGFTPLSTQKGDTAVRTR